MSPRRLSHRLPLGAEPSTARRALLPVTTFVISGALTLWLATTPPQHWVVDAAGLCVSLCLAWLVHRLQSSGRHNEALVARRTAELDASRGAADAIAERLRFSEQRFRNLFESIGDAIIVTGTDRRIQMVNPAMLRAFGYANDAPVIGQLSAITYADNEMFEEAGRHIRANTDGAPIMIDARFRRADGETFPAELRLCYLHDDAGETAGYIGVIRDTTDRGRAAAALRESEIFAKAVFDNSPVAIHVLDADGYSLRMNEAFKELMGLPSTDFGIGQFNVLTNGFFNRVGLSARFRQAYAGEVVEMADAVLELDADDLPEVDRARIAYDLTLFPIPAAGGGVQAVVSFARDISERKEADAARRAAEERLRLVVANLPIRVFAADADGVVTFVDGRLASLSGLPRESVVGCGVEAVFGAEPALLAAVRRGLAGEDFSEAVEAGGRIYEGRYAPIRPASGIAAAGLVWMYSDVTEREQAERARQESQANFTALIENSGDFMWSVRPGYRLLSANSAFLAAVRDRIGRDLEAGESVIHEGFTRQEQDEWRGYYGRALGGERFAIERQSSIPGGTDRSSEVRFNPIRDAAGEIIGVTVVSHDVTEAKQAERALRDNEERYRKTIENLHDVFYETDLDDTFTFLSASAFKLHGYRPEELVGTRTRDLWVHPADQEGLVAMLMAGRRVNDYEAQMRCKDGNVIWVSVNARVIARDGVAVSVQGTTRDITDRRRAEQAIRESEERYRKTFEGLHDVFYQTDAAGVITMMSPSCLRHTGYAPDELVGQPVVQLFADGERFTEIVSALAFTDTLNDQEAALRLRAGGTAPVSVNATALRDGDGAVIGYEGTLRDIAERKRAEEELDRVFNLTVDLLAVVAPGGTLQRVNPAWEATLGYTESELLGVNVWSLVHPDDVANSRHGARAIDRGEVVKDLRGRFRCKDGSWKWLGWSMTRAEGTDRIYCVARDVSELMHAEEQTRRAQQDLEETLEAMRASQAVLEEQAEAMDQMRIEAEHLANHDMLTGVVNRRAWFGQATAQHPTAVAIFDIDYFKRVNDTYGHPAGDFVLVEVSRRLTAALPSDALLGRLGGEEFGALFLGGFGEARTACEAAVNAVGDRPIELPDGTLVSITVSGGLSPWRPSQQSRERSLANTYEDADAALYEAKAAGRRTLTVRDTRRAA